MFTLLIHLDNDAFNVDANAEVARILRAVAAKVEDFRTEGICQDSNGATVGQWGLAL